MAPHSSILAWKLPWTEEPGRLQSIGSWRVGHDWVTSLSLFHFPALEKEMATHSSVRAWRIPGTGDPGGLPSMGSHRVGHDWSDLASTKVVRRHFFPLTPKEEKDLFLRQIEQKRMWLGAYQAWQREMVRNQTETRGINWTAAGWTAGPVPYSFQLPSLFDSKSTGN